MYKILGDKCPFGNGIMENGVMDGTQFRSDKDIDYRAEQECGRFAITVARQYGAEPCARIMCEVGTIIERRRKTPAFRHGDISRPFPKVSLDNRYMLVV